MDSLDMERSEEMKAEMMKRSKKAKKAILVACEAHASLFVWHRRFEMRLGVEGLPGYVQVRKKGHLLKVRVVAAPPKEGRDARVVPGIEITVDLADDSAKVLWARLCDLEDEDAGLILLGGDGGAFLAGAEQWGQVVMLEDALEAIS